MSRGVLLFAFNSSKYNYYDMAEHTAKRINHFLDLPVTLITDSTSLPSKMTYVWDNIELVQPNKDNTRDKAEWINKGRYQAYELSPYDETLLIDADYVVNSQQLLKIFDVYDDFCCHNSTQFLMHPNFPPEVLSAYSYEILWATVMVFKKTPRTKQIFDCMEMIQNNYSHYENIHGFLNAGYRNDYALTLALRIANGHATVPTDFIPWDLVHIGKNTQLYPNAPGEFNTEYTVMFDNWQRGKVRKEYITVKDFDFHVINKELFDRIRENT